MRGAHESTVLRDGALRACRECAAVTIGIVCYLVLFVIGIVSVYFTVYGIFRVGFYRVR